MGHSERLAKSLDSFLTLNQTTAPESGFNYIQYQNVNGKWYIQRESTAGAIVYAYGTSGASTAWTNRASESYNDVPTTW